MKSTPIRLLALLTLITCSSIGCAGRKNLSPLPTIEPRAKESLEAPVNCSTAKQDIAVLEDERASVAKQILSGVRSVVPFSAAAGILLGDYKDRAEVATGMYNEAIDDKIAQIKRRCVAYLGNA